tara:strand:+ start:233 stop:727 length:495 start_codon:yes stop_codon:yes gene_type:complete
MNLYSKIKISRGSDKSSFKEKVFHQIGALCYRLTDKNVRILLITSRRSKRWIIPKGWKVQNMNNRKSVALEAWEEAGVQGRVSDRSIGTYYYRKRSSKNYFLTCAVKVFSLEVKASKKKFPELGQRKLKWVTAPEAIDLVGEPELKTVIKNFIGRINKQNICNN